MARYEFTEPWPRGVIRRDVLIYRQGERRVARSVAVSPPARSVDLGEFPEGTELRLRIVSAQADGSMNKDAVERSYTIPVRPDVADPAPGQLVEFGQAVAEAGSPQPSTPTPTPTPTPTARPGTETAPAPASGLPA